MTSLSLSTVLQRVATFVSSYADASGRLGPLLQLKADHSRRVGDLCREVADELQWTAADLDLAQAAGWLHDVGRFEQYRRYGTFADPHSIDHGDLGATLFAQTPLGVGLPPRTAGLLSTVIRSHNKHTIPAGLEPAALALLQVVRDVDKLDIMALVDDALRTGAYRRQPGLLPQVSGEGPPTPELVAEVRAGRTGSYVHVRTLADIRLVGLAWTRDIVCLPVLRRIHQRGLTAGLAEALAGHPEAQALGQGLLRDLERRLAGTAAEPPPSPSRQL